jgi:poly-gamma-glutamate capsule biosynthesis protein CapA/YwtB (metallophosphatase superfamily)
MRRKLTRRSFIGYVGSATAGLIAACSGPEHDRNDPTAETRLTQRDSAATPRSPATRSPASPATGTPGTPTATGAATSPIAPPDAAATMPGAPAGPGLSESPASGSATATSTLTTQLTVGIDPALPVALQAQATALRDRLVRELQGVPGDDQATYVVTLAAETGTAADWPTLRTAYVAVVSRRLLVRDVSLADLGRLWNGEIDDWSAVGSPVPHGVVRITLNGSAGPFDPARATRDVQTFEDLAVMLLEERGGLAIVPLDQVDFRVRTLLVDGVNPFRPGEAGNPLGVDLQVRPRTTQDGARLRTLVASFAGEHGPQPVSMTWTGDIILGRTVHVKMVSYGDWAAPFRSIYPELTWADLTISNLECALSDNFETPTSPTTFDFKTAEAAIAGLQLGQIDIVSLANNHSYNFGAIGMRDTMRVLREAGIQYFGAGESIHESRQAVVVERGGTTYAFLGYNGISDHWDGATGSSPGTNPMQDWLVVEDIKREVAAGHVVIPFFHWGTEYVYDPTEQQRYFAHISIDSGAAVVMGSHPHWVQAVETYRGRPIVYSLGNFVFDQEWSRETKEGMIAHLWMQGDRPLKIDLVPVLIEDYHKPRRMAAWEAWPVLENVWAATDWIRHSG